MKLMKINYPIKLYIYIDYYHYKYDYKYAQIIQLYTNIK